MEKDIKNKKNYCNIGGQAVMEGVMMTGKKCMAIAVRDADGCIRLETKRLKEKKSVFFKIPVIRGVLQFIHTMITGVNTLMRSADVYGEGEPTKFEKWLSEKLKVNIMSVIAVISIMLGMGLAIALFVLLPTFLSDIVYNIAGLSKNASPAWYSVLVGAFKIIILISYLLAVSLIKDIKRTFMYHGAEHKTINCYESGKELTVENVQSFTTLHNRCGTTFLFYVIFISIIVFIILQQISTISLIDNYFLQTGVRILIIPVVAGLAYELLKFLAKHDLFILKPLKLPGLGLQRITTKEPDNEMVEVAITAFNAVQKMENDESIAEVKFVTMQKAENVYSEVKEIFNNAGLNCNAEIDWIFVHVLKVSRNKINETKIIKAKDYENIIQLAKQRAEGKPLQYVLGDTEFYGYKIKLNENVLIPRFDTELVAEKAISLVSKEDEVLDLCTGSGCIAIAVQKKTGCKMTAADKSEKALIVAEENAKLNGAPVTFLQSDMFNNLQGQKFNCIICNPPYIKSEDIAGLDSEVKDYEPISALDGGKDGLDFYRILAKEAKNHLKENGVIVLELGDDGSEDVKTLFSQYKETNIYKDLCGKYRIFTARG